MIKHPRLRGILIGVAAVCMIAAPAFAQGALPLQGQGYFRYGQWHGGDIKAARAQSAAATTIPMWGYTITSDRDGNHYPGVMVGRSPFFHGARTTNIPAVIIPVKVNMPDGGVFDPEAADPCASGNTAVSLVQNSPMLQAVDFNFGGTDVGAGQYIDSFQRANFFSQISATGNRYHNVLSPVTTLSEVTVTVPGGDGVTWTTGSTGGCEDFGLILTSFWDPSVDGNPGLGEVGTLLAAEAAHVNPTVLPIFLLHNVAISDNPNSLSGFVYHSSEGSPVQTYSVVDFDTAQVFSAFTDTAVMAHEIGEWMDDPLGTNSTPAWGHIGQQSGCQNNLEVGDALTGTFITPVTMNSFTYNLQELVFFSWFYTSTSIAANGWFSDNGTFLTDAGAPCI